MSGKGGMVDRVRAWVREHRTDASVTSFVLMLWFAAIIAHYDSRMHWERNEWYVIAPAIAFVGLFFTRSRVLVATILAGQMIACWQKMPTPDNHWFFSALVSGTMLAGLVWQSIRDREWPPKPLGAAWRHATVPALRCLIILLYLFAVFHKINADYFDLDLSCGVHFYKRAVRAEYFFTLPADPEPWLRVLVIYGVLALEFATPVFLAFRRTWWLGILAGATFHLMTALFMRHFPAIMCGLYFLFVPDDVQERFLARAEELTRRVTRWLSFTALFRVQVVFWTGWSVVAWFQKKALGVSRHHADVSYTELLRVWAGLMVLGGAAALVWAARAGHLRVPAAKRHLWSASKGLYAVPLLFVVNSFSPFLGYKTATSLAMWSNLLTANHYSNHLIIPTDALKVYPYLDDMVKIEKTNLRGWRKRYVHRPVYMPYVMFQRELGRMKRKGKRVDVRFVFEDVRYDLENAQDHPVFAAPQGPVFRKVVHVKPVRRDNKGTCTW